MNEVAKKSDGDEGDLTPEQKKSQIELGYEDMIKMLDHMETKKDQATRIRENFAEL